jgi:hypothetical protein
MKKFLLLLFILQSTILLAQFNETAPWMDSVQKKQTGDATIDEIKNAFDHYWEDKNYKKRGSGYKPFMRWETHWRNKVDESGYLISPQQLWSEWEKKINNQVSRNSIENAVSNWEPLGPYNYVNTGSWSSGLGRINVIVVDPNNANTLYFGAPAGGIWKSTDAGVNWTPLSDYLPQIGVSGIAIDHTNSDIIYIATGDKDASDTYSVGVLKSFDGGLTWNTTGLTFTNTSTLANEIFMHPTNPAILWVATSVGVYKTIDSGVTWVRNLTGNIKDIKIKPGNPDYVYAVTANRFYRSTNGGDSFSQISSGMPANSGRLIIDVTPANPEYVYVLSARTNWSHQGLYKSTDSGQTFAKTFNNADIFEADQAWYDMALAVSDTNPDEVYTGVLNIWKSVNGGNTFAKLNSWNQPFQAAYTHADIHFLRFYDGVLYCGSDGGIYKSTNGGVNFTDLTATAQIGQFYKISVAKQTSTKIAGGLQDNGGYALNNNVWQNYFGADGMDTAIDPNNSNKFYGFIQYGGSLYFSTNSGASSSGSINAPSGQTGNWVTPLAINSLGELYSGFIGLYKLINNTWTLISTSTFSGGNIEKITIDPTNDAIIYVGDGANLYKSEDGGITFSLYYAFSSAITGIEVNSLNNDIVYTTTSGTSGSAFKSINGGLEFTNIGQGLPNIAKNVIKHQGNHVNNPLYVGTSLGVYYIDDTLTSWVPFDINLPNVEVTDLEIHLLDEKIIASTYGRGIWQSPIPSQLAQNDLTLVSLESPIAEKINCNVNSISFLVKNTGISPVTNFVLNYTINSTPYTYNWNGNLESLASTTVQINNLSLIRGKSVIVGVVQMGNDTFPNNNSINTSILNNDNGTVGSVNAFETPFTNLVTSQAGDANLWQRGIPSGSLLNTAASGSRVYGTNLSGNYPDATKAYLYSQCYNLNQIANPVLKFKMAYDLEENWDVLYVEYTTDIGQTWNVLGTANDPNWYNSSQTSQMADNCYNCPGAQWTGTNTSIVEYQYPLNQFINQSNIIFRFVFHSDDAVNNEGVIIDDFVIDGTLSSEEFNMEGVAIYPNPSKGLFTISYGSLNPTKVEVFDVTGKIILTLQANALTNSEAEISLEKASVGVYFVKISNENSQIVKRIIKK